MYPHERSLVKKMEGRPFALLGINADPDRQKLKQVLKDENITWRSWWDESAGGPIAVRWNVQGWPTLYLLDHRGAIRNKWFTSPDDKVLDDAIEALVKEAEKAN
jgi:hypothetical protein